MAEMKPVAPPCNGNQYDENKEWLEVHFDENNNVIAQDKPMHENSTPGDGSFNFSGGQYHGEWDSGYGTEVSAPSGVKAESVDPQEMMRGRARETGKEAEKNAEE